MKWQVSRLDFECKSPEAHKNYETQIQKCPKGAGEGNLEGAIENLSP